MATVKLTLINAADGAVLGQSDMAASALPESFEKETVIHIGGHDWEVVHAEPVTAAEFIEKGELKLTISKISSISSDDIRFSLPTIAERLPDIADNYSYEGIIADMHEDNWRQCEFMPVEYMDSIQGELKQILEVWEAHSKASGEMTSFDKCHIRMIEPADLYMDIEKLKPLLGKAEFGSIKIGGRWIEDGFVLEDGVASYYGLMKKGIISLLCIDAINDNNLAQVKAVCAAFGLVAVDWCSCRLIK